MPIVRVQLPADALSAERVEAVIAELTELIAAAEQMPADPDRRTGLIILWEPLPAGAIRSNGVDPTGIAIPVFVWFHPPEGVMDDAHRAAFVAGAQELFERHGPDDRIVVTSVVFLPIADGDWGIGGTINHLPDFAARAGYAHLQHLVA
jgi:phenylpyruvate tautomerase PptA (4-oxalocrotonate tautomerase family)